uniref:Uncharacterized protein n=1 Tax=Knipowitschia caucasica TaxID=637954 RepID=A0AAV2M6U4_KNICA
MSLACSCALSAHIIRRVPVACARSEVRAADQLGKPGYRGARRRLVRATREEVELTTTAVAISVLFTMVSTPVTPVIPDQRWHSLESTTPRGNHTDVLISAPRIINPLKGQGSDMFLFKPGVSNIEL